jgi:hypothetical protein
MIHWIPNKGMLWDGDMRRYLPIIYPDGFHTNVDLAQAKRFYESFKDKDFLYLKDGKGVTYESYLEFKSQFVELEKMIINLSLDM